MFDTKRVKLKLLEAGFKKEQKFCEIRLVMKFTNYHGKT